MMFHVVAHLTKPDGTMMERNEYIDTTTEKFCLGIDNIDEFVKAYESAVRWGTQRTEVKICEVVEDGNKN